MHAEKLCAGSYKSCFLCSKGGNGANEFAKSVSKCERTKDYEIIDDLIFEAILLTITKFCEKVTVEECAKYSRLIRAILPKDALRSILSQ